MKSILLVAMSCVLVAQTKGLPAAITTAFQQQYPKATIKKFSKEKRAGKAVYEVESMDSGKSRDIIYAATGEALEIEEGIALDAIPEPVSAAVKAQYPKATITSAEKLTIGSTVQYEVILKGAAKKELILTPDGKPVK